MTAVANYCLQHPEAGTGSAWLHDPGPAYDFELKTNGNLELGPMRDTIDRLLKACPYDMRIRIWEGGAVFTVGFFRNNVSFSYDIEFDYFPREWSEIINRDAFKDLAPRWYFSGGPGV
jgi:hypothetical protein